MRAKRRLRSVGTPTVTAPAERLTAAWGRLSALATQRIELTLDRMGPLLARLGDPHRRLPPVVHIAGTNGKGSTQAFVTAMLRAAGYRVHSFTSPYLIRFNEQIRLDGRIIDDDALATVLERVETAADGRPATLFELTTAAALLAFVETPADAAVIEVGLGGRDDATNVIPPPAVAAITRISFDHMNFLGGDIASIAAHKAGIIKPGTPTVVGPQSFADAARVFVDAAAKAGAPLSLAGRDWSAHPTETGFVLRERGRADRAFPAPALPGNHQIGNAALAVLITDRLRSLTLLETAKAAGIAQAVWPGRLQRLTRGPLIEGLPARTALWVDGGHNDSAAAALADWLGGAAVDGPTDLIVGMLESKDPRTFLATLAPHVRTGRAVTIPAAAAARAPGGLAARPAAEIAGIARRAGLSAAAAPSIAAALTDLAGLEPPPARILITGSLFLAGAALERTEEADSGPTA